MISLRPPTDRDFDRVADWIDSPALLLQWAGGTFEHPFAADQLRAHVEESSAMRPFAAVDASGETVGYLELSRIDREHASASVSRVIVDPERRGEGHATAMVRAALAIAFDELDLHRVDLRVFEFNEPAVACYERVGFVHEGRFRDARKHGDDYWTLLQLSILDEEWERERA